MTPLALIAGFLGAGKTSFLRQLLPELGRRGVRPRVILNDYQNARVDAASLKDLVPTLVPISGSCLCCETQEELLEALGAMPLGPGDALVIETNGTTDTANLLELLTGEPRLARLSLPLQLTVVDAQRFGTRGWQNVLEREQIETATHVSVSRRDVVPPDRFAAVEAELARVAPAAVKTDPADFAGVIAALGQTLAGVPDRDGLERALRARTPHAALHDPRHHFASFQVPLPGRVDAAAFTRFLEELPPEIVRAKGVVELRDPPGERRLFQKVNTVAEISPCQLADPDEIEPVAVFIGTGAPMTVIRARLDRLLASP
jgi:G3E family GTPase